jgi:hypothetical protein
LCLHGRFLASAAAETAGSELNRSRLAPRSDLTTPAKVAQIPRKKKAAANCSSVWTATARTKEEHR